MALINCPECGKEISDKATACPNCGAPVSTKEAGATPAPTTPSPPSQTQQKSGKGCMWVLGVIGIVFAIMWIIGSVMPKKQPPAPRFGQITLNQYDQIQNGMTYFEVKQLVGSNGNKMDVAEINPEENYVVTYKGYGSDDAYAIITFENNRVIGKTKHLLESFTPTQEPNTTIAPTEEPAA